VSVCQTMLHAVRLRVMTSSRPQTNVSGRSWWGAWPVSMPCVAVAQERTRRQTSSHHSRFCSQIPTGQCPSLAVSQQHVPALFHALRQKHEHRFQTMLEVFASQQVNTRGPRALHCRSLPAAVGCPGHCAWRAALLTTRVRDIYCEYPFTKMTRCVRPSSTPTSGRNRSSRQP
jgi:hypothetical protein